MPDAPLSYGNGLAHFIMDARSSRFTVQAFATGLLSAMGHNPIISIPKFSGEVDFNPEASQVSSFRLTIQSASLAVQDDISDKDRREMERMMKGEVLEATRYPEITYAAPSIEVSRLDHTSYTAVLEGKLDFHGVTRAQPVTARIMAFGEMLRASGNFTLKQSDYQIKPISVAAGGLKLKDELKFSFDIVARRQG